MNPQTSLALGWSLVHSLWEGSLMAAALWLFNALVRSARIRYLAACGTLLALLAAFLLTFFYFLPRVAGLPALTPKPSLALPQVAPLPLASPPLGLRMDGFVLRLAPVWIFGVCLGYLRFGVSWIFACRFRRRAICKAPLAWQLRLDDLARELGITKVVALVESLLADSPAVFGLVRPVVLVPLGFLSGLPPGDVELILLHELAHIRRWDYLVNVCQRMVEALLFYHPAAWWISHVIRREREHCCDDLVVNVRGEAHTYATALTNLEERRLEKNWLAPEFALNAKGGTFVKRIRRLLDPRRPVGVWAPVSAVLVLATSTAMAFSAWHLKPLLEGASNPWQKWLDEDVVYIITSDERQAFQRLETDADRQRFVEQFWLRRDPTLGTPANEYKEEHYRRIAFANDHYGVTNVSGWKTDRGRIYIRYGPPDEIDSHPDGGRYQRPSSEGGGSAFTYPFEDWQYSHFEGVGRLSIEFVDVLQTGEFHMTLNPNEKYRQP